VAIILLACGGRYNRQICSKEFHRLMLRKILEHTFWIEDRFSIAVSCRVEDYVLVK